MNIRSVRSPLVRARRAGAMLPWAGKCIFLLLTMLLTLSSSSRASTYVPLEDAGVYALLSRLEAEGVIPSAMLDTRPISRTEAFRLLHEAEEKAKGRSGAVGGLVRMLKERLGPEPASGADLKPQGSAYAKYIHTNAQVVDLAYGRAHEQEQAFNANNDGDLLRIGSNYRAGVDFRLEDLGPLSLYLQPEYRSPDEDHAVLKTGYAVIGISSIDVVAGRDAQWWGPGYHAANLVSNNAEPFTMVRIDNPEPVSLPWLFRYLGPLRFTLFSAKLERDRSDFAEPYLNGIRVELKPLPFLELGLEKVQMLGGSGRQAHASTWIKSFLGVDSHPSTTSADATNSEAGGDIKLTLPFDLQPLQVYWQRDGEDGRQRTIGAPYKFADIYGLYLPRLLGWDAVGVRVEYASNHVNGWPDIWYTHSVYTSGMTYKGMIFGNAMGTDARDFFTEITCLLPQASTTLSLSFDQKTHDLSDPVRERSRETVLSAEKTFLERIDVKLSLAYGTLINAGNTSAPRQQERAAAVMIRYRL